MKRLLDILIISWLTILIINLFSWKTNDNTNQDLVFSPTKTSYTIPASVWLNILNNTKKEVILNTCENIKINKSWNIINFNKDFCKDIKIAPKEKKIIEYSDEYENFSEIWNYNFKINLNKKEYLTDFEISNPWVIKKIFTYIFYAPIYNLMIFLIKTFGSSLWWGIISITIFIRLLLIWPQHKMMVSQKKLQAIQPKIKKIQEEYKWQQQVLWVKLMELYKTEKVNPMWSCWFLLIQMPILLVLYRVIFSIKDHSNYYYLYSWLVKFDLWAINHSFFSIDLLAKWWIAWISLAIFVWVIQFIQVKLSLINKKPDTDIILEKKKWSSDYSQFMPDPEMMNKFMLYWMPVMVGMFTYNLFAWIGVYWGISTTIMIFQQLFVNIILKKSKR